MSIEERIKKRGNQKLNKYAKNPYHVSWVDRMPLWSKIAVPASLLTTMTALVVIIALPKNANTPTTNSNSNSVSVAPSIAPSIPQSLPPASNSLYYVPDWNERAINDQYRMLLFNKVNYYSYLYPAIEEEYIEELVAEDILMWGEESVDDNGSDSKIRHETNVSLYKIKGFSTKMIVAVKFTEDNQYYWYKNITDKNQYPTLGDFLSDFDLNEVAAFSAGFYDYKEDDSRYIYKYEGIAKEQVMTHIFGDTSAYFTKDAGGKAYSQYTNFVSIGIYMPRLHLDSAGSNGSSGLTFYDNGFLKITFLNVKYWFYVGEEHYQAFKDYMLNNLTGEYLPNHYHSPSSHEEPNPSSYNGPSSTTLP